MKPSNFQNVLHILVSFTIFSLFIFNVFSGILYRLNDVESLCFVFTFATTMGLLFYFYPSGRYNRKIDKKCRSKAKELEAKYAYTQDET